ncbi:MAG: hypothetical protein ACREHD_13600, partial [Pirellulales bacterium]
MVMLVPPLAYIESLPLPPETTVALVSPVVVSVSLPLPPIIEMDVLPELARLSFPLPPYMV